MDCTDKRVIHTIGHSTRSIEAFAGLLRAHDIHLVLDVRRWPMSKRHPHFNREALANALKGSRIGISVAPRPRRFSQTRSRFPSIPAGAWARFAPTLTSC